MATLKHIASKNSDYSAAEAYLIYQHDEFTGKQLLDEQGRPMLRESYTFWTLLSVAIIRLQRPVCWQTESTARTTTRMISKATSISSALTPEMQPTTA